MIFVSRLFGSGRVSFGGRRQPICVDVAERPDSDDALQVRDRRRRQRQRTSNQEVTWKTCDSLPFGTGVLPNQKHY
jgi:hypothetical protein